MRTALYILLSSFLLTPSIFVFSQEGEDAASASATGSAAAPAKGAPKSAQANSKLRVLHIAIHKHGHSIASIKKALERGGLGAILSSYTQHGAENFGAHGDLLMEGHTLEDAKNYGEFLRDPANAGKSVEEALADAKIQHADKYATPSLLIKDAETLALSRYGTNYSSTSQFSTALALATTLLTDFSVTSTLPTSLPSVDQLTDGYNLAFIRLLSAYGALGSSGENLAGAVLGTDYSGYSSEATLASLAKSSSVDYLSFLSSLTGERTFKSEQWDPVENTVSSVLNVPLSNVQLSAASTITLGQSTSDSEVDVSSKLSKASKASERKVLVIGAAKDLNTAGNIRFTNTNDAEDHALVLGAADDVMIKDTDIEYTGSNLGIGSGDTGASSMFLVNTNIKTGGNLAVGSLGTMNITDAGFSVGLANSTTSDPDNVYLYANELIKINNLGFSGRVDDIYMESKTIYITNTSFPATADVMLRSQKGSIHFPTSASNVSTGGVNFTNVKHLGISNSALESSHFSGVDGHINSSATLPNGTPFIKIRAQ
jgi:hypothetical protein